MFTLERSFYRFVRVFVAGGLVYGSKLVLKLFSDIDVPEYMIPLYSAILSSVSKFLREKTKISLPF